MNLPVASPTLRKLLEHWLAAVFVVVLFTFGVVADWVFHKRSRAELLLRSITELRLGTSAFTEARELAQEYGGKSERGGSERGCSAQACTFTFVIDNRPLNYIPGVRGVRFVAAIGVKDGYVTSREVDYAIMNSTGLDFMYTVLDHLESAKGLEVRKLNLDPMGRPHPQTCTPTPARRFGAYFTGSRDATCCALARRKEYRVAGTAISRLRPKIVMAGWSRS